MLNGDSCACAGAALSLRQSGRMPTGRRVVYGRGLGSVQTDAAVGAINTANTYMKTEGDALKTFSTVLGSLSALSLAIPQPFGTIVAGLAAGSAKGLNVVTGYLDRSAKKAVRYLPLAASANVLANMKSAWGTYGLDAAKDKICQSQRKDVGTKLAVGFGNLIGGLVGKNALDCKSSNRLAKRVYNRAKSAGAPEYAAAMAAWAIAKDAGCPKATLDSYAIKVGAVNSVQRANPESVWAQKVKLFGKEATAAQVAAAGKSGSTLTEQSGGGGAGAGLALAAIAALALLG
jgi:hypothetical protein